MKTRLLGTSPSLEMSVKLISEYFCGEPITLIPEGEIHRVKNSVRAIPGLRVILKKGRYRFEMEIV
jgi:hypothetical protein